MSRLESVDGPQSERKHQGVVSEFEETCSAFDSSRKERWFPENSLEMTIIDENQSRLKEYRQTRNDLCGLSSIHQYLSTDSFKDVS